MRPNSSLLYTFPLLYGAAAAATWPPAASAPSWPPAASAAPWNPIHGNGNSLHTWGLEKFESLVVFGDSYSDASRLGYFIDHDGAAPPVGTILPESVDAADSGRIWGRYVTQYTGINFYDYAVSGAVCSNEITPRFFDAAVGFFPDIQGYELPAFIADAAYIEPNGTKPLDIDPSTTVYAIWIGTNDVGNAALLTDSQFAGTNAVSYINCVFDQMQKLCENGGRYFVSLNLVPLNLAPQYALPSAGGLTATQYYPDKHGNDTEISARMLETVVTLNQVYATMLPYQVAFEDIYNNPAEFLNGTAPLNVTSYINLCVNLTAATDCVLEPSPDSFMWYDPLHPSEQTERLVAQNFVDIVQGKSNKYGTYWSQPDY